MCNVYDWLLLLLEDQRAVSIFEDGLFWLCFRWPFVATSVFIGNGTMKASIEKIKAWELTYIEGLQIN